MDNPTLVALTILPPVGVRLTPEDVGRVSNVIEYYLGLIEWCGDHMDKSRDAPAEYGWIRMVRPALRGRIPSDCRCDFNLDERLREQAEVIHRKDAGGLACWHSPITEEERTNDAR